MNLHEAYQRGQFDRLRGIAQSGCPFGDDLVFRQEWEEGWQSQFLLDETRQMLALGITRHELRRRVRQNRRLFLSAPSEQEYRNLITSA